MAIVEWKHLGSTPSGTGSCSGWQVVSYAYKLTIGQARKMLITLRSYTMYTIHAVLQLVGMTLPMLSPPSTSCRTYQIARYPSVSCHHWSFPTPPVTSRWVCLLPKPRQQAALYDLPTGHGSPSRPSSFIITYCVQHNYYVIFTVHTYTCTYTWINSSQ